MRAERENKQKRKKCALRKQKALGKTRDLAFALIACLFHHYG